jgi:hypothetical protein
MKQPSLFPEKPAPKRLVCSFGTDWLDHFDQPIGTGKGCVACAAYPGDEPKGPKR